MPSARESADRDAEIAFLEQVRVRLPDHLNLLKALAELYTEAGRYLDGYECDAHLIALDPRDGLVWYNYACSCALIGEPQDALDALEKAIDLGYDDLAWMARDPDLQSLHVLPQFKALQRTRLA